MSSDASETHFFTCACPVCAGSGGGFSADDGTVTGGASAPPVFTLSQIQTQLRTQWGGTQEGKTWTWLNTTTVSYSIDTAVTGQSEASGLVNMTPLMEDRARLAFELWDDLIALTLNESPGNTNANITFNYSSNTSGGGTYAEWSGYSSGGNFGFSRAYIWLNNGWNSHNTDASMAFGRYGFMTYLHEIGHTLGLSHPGTYDAGNGGSITYANNAEYAQDSHRYTVMSYFDANEAESFVDHYGSTGAWRYAQTPLLHDIAAIQAAYGADTTTRTGDTVYGFNATADRVVYNFAQNPDPILVIWDSGGTDTLDCSGYSTNQLINLTAGSYSNIGYLTYNVAIAFNCTIENATGGTGADTINGNSANNVLSGGNGADTIDGADGNDTINGNAGNDTMWGGAADDTFVYSTGADTIKDFTAGAGGVDEIDLRGVSGVYNLADVLARATQVGANTVINFGSGNTLTLENVNRNNLVSGDFLFSAPPSGTDLTASGLVLNGTSIDFTINNVGVEAAATSTTGIYLSTDGTITSADTLVTTMATSGLAAGASVAQGTTLTFPGNLTPGTYYLGVLADYNNQVAESSDSNNASNTAALILGNDSANTLAGTSAADTLFGLAGDDMIDGGAGNDLIRGGDGTDRMDGGAGADVYDGGAGYDYARYMFASMGVTASLATSGSNTGDAAGDTYLAIEGLVGSNFNDTLTGDGADNQLWGIDGNDTFDGGAGNDAIWGGAGDDTFVYSSGADAIRDFVAGAGGVDEIDLRSVSGVYSLADVLARAVQVGANTVIDFGGGNTLTLDNINKNSLVSGDFLFSPAPPQADLTASGVALNGASISFTINNIGTAAASASTAGIYLSTDSTITGADTLVTSIATSGLSAGGSANLGTPLTFPGNLAPGTYYLGVLADYNGQIAEGSESNNASNTVPIILGNDSANTLTGTSGADIVFGQAGDDTINGGAGNDTMWGGTDDDTFVYSTGADAIKDFTAGAGGVDEIDLRNVSGVYSLADVLSRATQVGANTVIDFGSGNTLALENIDKNNLVSGDFLFSAPPSTTDLTAGSLVLNGTSVSFTINNIGANAAAGSTTGI
ncbi:MAG: M10 family metallopeptidase C-terminal domain-containing protein, partial [Xanthobacteraceae bacterium]|nr:M10 family metallopeptidase C-terminal domain-containing protein [Xanthobacteraceae bacterium]